MSSCTVILSSVRGLCLSTHNMPADAFDEGSGSQERRRSGGREARDEGNGGQGTQSYLN